MSNHGVSFNKRSTVIAVSFTSLWLIFEPELLLSSTKRLDFSWWLQLLLVTISIADITIQEKVCEPGDKTTPICNCIDDCIIILFWLASIFAYYCLITGALVLLVLYSLLVVAWDIEVLVKRLAPDLNHFVVIITDVMMTLYALAITMFVLLGILNSGLMLFFVSIIFMILVFHLWFWPSAGSMPLNTSILGQLSIARTRLMHGTKRNIDKYLNALLGTISSLSQTPAPIPEDHGACDQ
jgi:hypothetical protein